MSIFRPRFLGDAGAPSSRGTRGCPPTQAEAGHCHLRQEVFPVPTNVLHATEKHCGLPCSWPSLPKEEASGVLARDTLFTGPRPASPVSCPLSWAPPAPARPICSRRLPTAFNHASPSDPSSPPRPPARRSAEYLTHASSFNLHHHPHFVYDEAKAERMSLSNSPSVRGRIETQVAMPLTSTLYCPLCYRAGVSEDSLGAGAL